MVFSPKIHHFFWSSVTRDKNDHNSLVFDSLKLVKRSQNNNGPDGVNCDREVCSGTNGPMDGPSGTPCTREEPAAIPHYNTEPTAGQPYQTSGNITPTHPSALDPPAPISAALVQAADHRLDAFMQQPAKPETHVASAGAGTSIIGILEVVESDFATNLAKEESAEATAQDAFEKMEQENKITKATKEKDVEYKTKEAASLDKTIGELSADRETVSSELSAVSEYLAKLNERCIAKPETYESRKARREAEIAGLKEALAVLSETSFAQRGVKTRSGRVLRGGRLAVGF